MYFFKKATRRIWFPRVRVERYHEARSVLSFLWFVLDDFSYTPHCWGQLVLVQSSRTIHTSKDVCCWILRLWPWNFAIKSESLPANLKKVRQIVVWQTVPHFWFIDIMAMDLFDFNIFLFALLTRVCLCGTIKKTSKSELCYCLLDEFR